MTSSVNDPNVANNSATTNTTVDPCPGIIVALRPLSMTYNPTRTKSVKKNILVTVINSRNAPVTIVNIIPQAGQPFEVVSISPITPLTIARTIRKKTGARFIVQTRRAAGLPKAVATAPYFSITMSCGSLTTTEVLSQTTPPYFKEVSMELQADQLLLQARGTGIESLHLQLFDLIGRKLMDRTGDGNTMILPARANDGESLPNGVYLYVLTTRIRDVNFIKSEVRKLVVKR